MRILLVEDNVDCGRPQKRLIEKQGHECRWTQDGDDAIHETLEWLPDLVLLDVMMPGKDGFAVLQEIRAAGSMVFVAMLTALKRSEFEAVALAAGANQYLAKPLTNDDLQNAINQIAGKLTAVKS